MDIGFIGAGKVGVSLGKYLADHHNLIGYASRSYSSAQEAAHFTESDAFESPLDLCRACETIFLTVPDGAIEQVWNELKTAMGVDALKGKNICHCSGALASTALTEAQEYGCFVYSVHPLFAVSSKTRSYAELHKAFFAVEGSPEHLDDIVALIADKGNRVQVIDTDGKVRYHAAAALASNHVVALYRLACDQLVLCGFSPAGAESALAPLFLGNAEHVAHDGAVASLTGPAERGDMATIEKHLACLEGDAHIIYEKLNAILLELAAEKHA